MPHSKACHRHLIYVDWSEEDQLYIGYCSDLFYGGICHADSRLAAYAKLVDVVEDDLVHRMARGEPVLELTARPSPPSTMHGQRAFVWRKNN